MSELQAALLAIGAGIVVAVYGLGRWQQRKYQRKFGAAFKANHADVLYHGRGERSQEAIPNQALDEAIPSRDAPPIQLSPASGRKGERENEAEGRSFEERPMHFLTLEDEAPFAEKPAANLLDGSCALLDARFDFIIELYPVEPSPSAVLGGLWQRKFDFGKPVQVCGLTLVAKQWERAITESQTLYTRFRIALQLVDRGGVISATKLADFRDLVLGVAGQIKADTAVPDVNESHRRATELDAFCAEVDQMIGINLVPPGERMLTGARIALATALHGMALEADGAFHLKDAFGHSVLSLINQNNKPFQHHNLETFGTPGITLLLDVPRVEKPALQFDRMVRIAHELARELQVNMLDDNRVVLRDNGLDRIREQIEVVEAKMCNNGIAPGSGQARRLFS